MHRLGRPGLVFAVGFDEGQPYPPRHLGLGRADEFEITVELRRDRKASGVEHMVGPAGAGEERQFPLALGRVEAIGQHQRLQRAAGARDIADAITAQEPVERARVDRRDAGFGADLLDHRGERQVGRPAVEPVAGIVVFAVRPERGLCREPGEGPRVPGPDMGPRHIEHLRTARGGVVARFRPETVEGPQILHLDEIVAFAGRVIGPGRFRAFGIEELVGLVGAAVDGGAADLGEMDRFCARHPGGGVRRPHTAGPVVVPRRPPVRQVLVAEDPGFAIRAVGDRRADLGIAIGRRGVEPVVALAAEHVRAQVVEVVD